MNAMMCSAGLPTFRRGLSRLQGGSVNVGDVDRFTERNQSTTTRDVITQELKFRHLTWWAEGKVLAAQS
jgi:hypothetical protein